MVDVPAGGANWPWWKVGQAVHDVGAGVGEVSHRHCVPCALGPTEKGKANTKSWFGDISRTVDWDVVD